MSSFKNLIVSASFMFLSSAVFSSALYAAEKVKITTYIPAPYGSYKDVQVQNENESATIAEFTLGLTRAGINIVMDYPSSRPAYIPGIFWSTSNNYPSKPKAGIWLYEYTNESRLYFGTSNFFETGITKTMVLDKNGGLGIGLTAPEAPAAMLDVNGVGAHLAGTAAAPGFAIRGDLDTGMYTSAANTLSFSTGGIQRTYINSSGNVGVDTTYTPPVAASNGAAGNLDVNDVWVRNGNKWLGQVGVSAAGSGWGVPVQSGTYTGNYTVAATGNNRLIQTTSPPNRVMVWSWNGTVIRTAETWKGLLIDGDSNNSFYCDDTIYAGLSYLRIPADQTIPGFLVGGNDAAKSTNVNGRVYYWYAWN